MTAPEVSDQSDEVYSAEEERRMERLMDNAGFAGNVATVAMTGYDDEITVRIPHKQTHHSHRGGRSYPEDDRDEFWNPTLEKLDDEAEAKRQANQQGPGHQKAALQANIAATNSMQRRAGGDVKRLLALQRAAADKRARGK